MDKHKEYIKKYYKDNKKYFQQYHKEHTKRYNEKYYQEHKKYSKEYYLKHKKRILNYSKKYRKEHKNIIKHNSKIYQLTANYIYSIIEFRANKFNTEITIGKKEFIKWYNKQEKNCYYCNRTLDKIKQDKKEKNRYKNRLSIDRKDNNKGYTLKNIVLACYRCNTIKGHYFTEQEMLEIGKILYKKDKLK